MYRTVLLALCLVGCAADQLTDPTRYAPSFTTDSLPSVVKLIGVGDVHARCKSTDKDAATARLLADEPEAAVFVAGDAAHPYGDAYSWGCYDRTWGAVKSRTIAYALGNHEQHTDPTATATYDYWNGSGVDSGTAGQRGKGYYLVEHGAWTLYVLNTDYAPYWPGVTDTTILTRKRNGMREQSTWVKKMHVERPSQCSAAVLHRPFWTSVSGMKPAVWLKLLWPALTSNVDLILAGHHHHYERIKRDSVTAFVVGTGGSPNLNYFVNPPVTGSQVRYRGHGVLFFALDSLGYRFEYRTIAGTVADSGSGVCR